MGSVEGYARASSIPRVLLIHILYEFVVLEIRILPLSGLSLYMFV